MCVSVDFYCGWAKKVKTGKMKKKNFNGKMTFENEFLSLLSLLYRSPFGLLSCISFRRRKTKTIRKFLWDRTWKWIFWSFLSRKGNFISSTTQWKFIAWKHAALRVVQHALWQVLQQDLHFKLCLHNSFNHNSLCSCPSSLQTLILAAVKK